MDNKQLTDSIQKMLEGLTGIVKSVSDAANNLTPEEKKKYAEAVNSSNLKVVVKAFEKNVSDLKTTIKNNK